MKRKGEAPCLVSDQGGLLNIIESDLETDLEGYKRPTRLAQFTSDGS